MSTQQSQIGQSLARLSVGIIAIVAVSSILLVADRGARYRADAPQPGRLPQVALVQHASIEPLDNGVKGILDALAQRGYEPGRSMNLTSYNAQGDFATANTIAKAVVGDDLDLIITSSTISLQTVAAANRLRPVPKKHLFGIVTNPFDAGVGANREYPLQHPPYLAGLGSNSPVRELFELSLKLQPSLRTIGLVWNPAEASSEASTLLAREVVKDLGLELLEGNAENSGGAGEVVKSLLSRGIDVLWLSTDVTTTTAQAVMIKAATQAGIPVIASMPSAADDGALIALGASYYTVGFEQGQMAADILQGRDPATIPIINWTPAVLRLNLTALDRMRQAWVIPPDVRARAQTIFDANGVTNQDVPAPEAPKALGGNR
jgi:ABC-type uncharacterized transport system substrate-binding protein